MLIGWNGVCGSVRVIIEWSVIYIISIVLQKFTDRERGEREREAPREVSALALASRMQSILQSSVKTRRFFLSNRDGVTDNAGLT